MSLLVRKINLAKWKQINYNESNDISADAITACLRTKDNTLSLWHIATEEEVDKAVLAMVTNGDKIEKQDFVIIDVESIYKHNLTLVETPGATPVVSMVNSHRDLSNLTYTKLGQVKDIIVDKLIQNKVKQYTVATLRRLITSALESGYLKPDALTKELLSKLPNFK